MNDERKTRFELSPRLPAEAEPILRELKSVFEKYRRKPKHLSQEIGQILRSEVVESLADNHRRSASVFLQILQDLVNQGWAFEFRNAQVVAYSPDHLSGESQNHREIKQRLRLTLVEARNEQLREESTRRFIHKMERPKVHRGRHISIQSLFLTPGELASDLNKRLDAPVETREELLYNSIDPYIQRATHDKDEHTNLRLNDIWRYCRYTWSLPLSSQPGREMRYLIRDASREFHPIIGIGALGNSVVQLSCRDREIGWTLEALEDGYSSNDTAFSPWMEDESLRTEWLRVLENEVLRSIEEIYHSDLLEDSEITSPSEEVIIRLEEIAKGQGQGPLSKRLKKQGHGGIIEITTSETFTRKRARALRKLLIARREFDRSSKNVESEKTRLEQLLSSQRGRRALKTAIRSVKKRHIGSSMMEITTCGALPPYSTLLGGKLVGLLMASPTVVRDYQERYSGRASNIASRMRGEKLARRANLVLVNTTSLYHVGSSQYNRLRAPLRNGELRYTEVGLTKGFGSIHLSRKTYRSIKELLEHHPGLEPESSAFAAGVNFKMRSISSALSHLGLSALQQHEMPRIVYMVPLAMNWREYLTGMSDNPDYLFDENGAGEEQTRNLVEFWKERWYVPRVKRDGILERLEGDRELIRLSTEVRRQEPQRESAPDPEEERLEGKDQPPNGNAEAMNDRKHLSWKTFAQLHGDRASFAELLTDRELEQLHVRTKMDDALLPVLKEVGRVYLTGNPGDGKTHLIRKHKEALDEMGVFVNLDASATDEGKLVGEIRSCIEEGRSAVVAINEGPLRRLRGQLPEDEAQAILRQLDEPVVYAKSEEAQTFEPLVVNMGLRSALHPAIVDSVIDLTVNRVDYAEAPKEIRQNRDAIATPRIRKRLRELLQLVGQSGGHVTMHQLLAFMAFIVTAGKSDSGAGVGDYFELVFTLENPLAGPLAAFDPAGISHPELDRCIWDGDPRQDLEWLRGGTLQPLYREPRDVGLKRFQSLKRKYLFEGVDGSDLLTFLSDERRAFFELVGGSLESVETTKIALLEALSHFFGELSLGSQSAEIQIWTSLRYEALQPPTAFLSSSRVPGEDVRLGRPRLRSQVESVLEYEPSHVRLIVDVRSDYTAALDVDLDLWIALQRLRRGMPQRLHDPVIGRRLNQFMARLATKGIEEDRGFVKILVRDVEESEKTIEVDVSIERGMYKWD